MHNMLTLKKLTGLIILLCLSVDMAQAIENKLRERITFWRQNFTILSPEEDPHVDRALEIFDRLVNIAGIRSGVTPMLYIIKDAPPNIPLPMAIPDGWIIISKNTLNFVYENPAKGDALLAFVLAHEISHQIEDDFWHMRFFQATDAVKKSENAQTIQEIQSLAAQTDKMIAKELRADEQGITLATMAGFDVNAVLEQKNNESFFKRWINRFSSNNFSTEKTSATHPSPQQRVLAIHSRLVQIQQQSQLFNLGLWLYQAGQYEAAKEAFEEFRFYYSGRAVIHNIALCNQQMALKLTAGLAKNEFRTTLVLDVYTYASMADRNSKAPADSKAVLLDKAIALYQQVIARDPGYIPAQTNLASAYLEKKQPYKAIALLNDAIEIEPANSQIMNDLAIAFYSIGDVKKSGRLLQQALHLSAKNTDILYNLGLYYLLQGDKTNAQNIWSQFVKLEPDSRWSKQVTKKLGLSVSVQATAAIESQVEQLATIQIGHYLDELPAEWTLLKRFSLEVKNQSYQLSHYQNGLLLISLDDEISYIAVTQNYMGNSLRGIKIDDLSSVVSEKYGTPDEIQMTDNGNNMIYHKKGISFQVINNKISSWLIFRG